MVEVALAERHEETDTLDLRQIFAEGFDLLVVQQIHVLLADLIEGVRALNAHSRDFDPVAVFPIAAGRRNLAQVDLRIEVCRERITMIAAVAVQNIDGIDGIELVLFSVGAVRLRDARVKAAAEQRGEAGLFKLLFVCPLPAVIKIGGEARFLAALFVNGAPFGVIGVLRLVVCGIHVVNTAGEAGIHNGEILIRQSDVHDEIRLVALDKVTKLLHVVCIDLCRGDFCFGDGRKLCGKCIALGLCAACDAQLGENFADLAAFGNGDTGYAAAADNKNFAHDDAPFIFLV